MGACSIEDRRTNATLIGYRVFDNFVMKRRVVGKVEDVACVRTCVRTRVCVRKLITVKGPCAVVVYNLQHLRLPKFLHTINIFLITAT